VERVKGEKCAKGWVVQCANGYYEWRRARRLARERAKDLRAAYRCPVQVRRPNAYELKVGVPVEI